MPTIESAAAVKNTPAFLALFPLPLSFSNSRLSPDTYGSSTPTGASILSSLVSKGYIFLLFKIYMRVVGDEIWMVLPLRWVLAVLGLGGMIAGSISAIIRFPDCILL